MKMMVNEMKVRLTAQSENEGTARSVVSVFAASLNPTIEQLADLRCAVSEAVTNCIVHAYRGERDRSRCYIYISVRLYDNGEISVEVADKGCGIPDIEAARRPLFTTDPDSERCGMGFAVMESFTDSLKVKSKVGQGTTVLMKKSFRR